MLLLFLVQNIQEEECQNSYLVREISPEDEEAIVQVKKLFQLPTGENTSPTPVSNGREIARKKSKNMLTF